MPLHLGKRNVALVEQPTLIERKTLAGGFGTIQRECRCEKEKKTTQNEMGLFHGVGGGVVASV
jgi:hypothetical protein